MKFLSSYFKVFTLLILFGCCVSPAYAVYYDFSKSLTFGSIDCMGNIKLIIKQTKDRKDDVVIAPKNVKVKVRKHTLLIREMFPEPQRKPVIVKIRLSKLDNLSTYGLSSVVGRITSEHLKIHAENSSNIKLHGLIALRELVTDGKAKVNLNQLNSQKLAVVARGNSQVYLSGRVINMVVRLRQYAKLNAKNLRVKDAMVQTHGFSNAMIFPIDSLRAFASDRSNIYFYKQPKHLSRNTSGSGNILQVAWRN